MKKSLGERVRELREEKGISQAGLARLVGISQPAIRDLELRKAQRTRYLAELAKALEVSTEYLSGESHLREPQSIKGLIQGDDENQAPLLPVQSWVQAGIWTQNHQIDYEDQALVRWPYAVDVPEGVTALDVRGNSMDEIYPPGSIVFVQDIIARAQEGRYPLVGDIVVARREDRRGEFEYTLKELQKDNQGNFILAYRSKSLYPTKLRFEPDDGIYTGHAHDDGRADSCSIVGVVLGGIVNHMTAG